MAQEPSQKPKGCFRSLILGIGCGCVYPAAMLLLLAFLGWFFLADPLHQLAAPPALPEFAGPRQEDFWSLQEKRLDQENIASPSLSLTPSEFNAYLNSWQIPPVYGFCMQRARFVPGDTQGTFYLIGSGFAMRNLIIQVEAINSGTQLQPGKIRINSWAVPESGWVRNQFDRFLFALLTVTPDGLPVRFLEGRATFAFSANEILLNGAF